MKVLGTLLTLLLSLFFNLLPKFILYRFSDLFFLLIYYVVGYRRKVVRKNLTNSFPEKSTEEIVRIERKFYIHLSDTFVENCAFFLMPKWRVLRFVKIEQNEELDHFYDQKKSIVAVTGHYGNWEMFFAIPRLSKYQVLGVYKPLSNKYYDKLFFRMRKKFGAIPVSMNDSYKTMLSEHKKGNYSILGLIADQRPPKKGFHYWTNFLNQETAMLLGPEKISKKLNAPVFFVSLERQKRGSYIMKSEILFDETKHLDDYEITETHIKYLTNLINEKPELWLWSHDRWKHKRVNE